MIFDVRTQEAATNFIYALTGMNAPLKPPT